MSAQGDPLFDRTAGDFARRSDLAIERGEYPRGRVFSQVLRRELRPGARILDYGCGPGRLARLLASAGYRVHGVDPSAEMLEVARAQANEGLVIDFQRLSENGSLPDVDPFAAIVCSSVIEYVDDPAELLGRLRGALEPGGLLALSYSNLWSLWRVYERLRWPDKPHLAVQRGSWSFARARSLLEQGGFEAISRPVYFEAPPFDRRRWLRRLGDLPCVGTLTLVTARRPA